jgi:hypothetical protein
MENNFDKIELQEVFRLVHESILAQKKKALKNRVKILRLRQLELSYKINYNRRVASKYEKIFNEISAKLEKIKLGNEQVVEEFLKDPSFEEAEKSLRIHELNIEKSKIDHAFFSEMHG